MDNVLMRFCRLSHRLGKKQVASRLGITLRHYQELETGTIAMTQGHAKQLASLYHTKARYFLESADQLETFHARGEIVKILQSENTRMNTLLEGGYEMLHENRAGKTNTSHPKRLTWKKPA